MKQRNKWKRRLSVLLMVVMMLNTVFVAQAADVGWQKEPGEDGRWYYLNQDGDMITDEPKISGGKWYYLGSDGYMATNKFIELNGLFYAQSSGALAENKWVKVKENWYRFGEISVNGNDEDGILTGGAVGPGWAEVQGKYYCFDDEHKMLTGFITEDKVGQSFNEHFDDPLYYAHKDGDLANHEWLLLDEGGKECEHLSENCGCSWYYFRGLEVIEGNKLNGGAMINKEKKVGEEGFCLFREDGKMVSRDWCNGTHDDKNDNTKHYYTSKGFRAVDQWLPINGYWYHFNKEGKVTAYAEIPEAERKELEEDAVTGISTPSDAPYRTVVAVKPVKDVVEVLVGEKEVKIDFQVELASNSNAKYGSDDFIGNAHDMRLKASGSVNGGVKVTDEQKGICTVTFNAGTTASKDQIIVYIDDVESAPVNIHTVLPKTDSDSGETDKGEVKQALDNILKPDKDGKIDTTKAKDGLKEVYANSKEETENHLLDNTEDLKNVDDKHAEDKKITKEDPDISEKVKDAVGDVTVDGSALNADPGDTVQLKVDEPKDDSTDWNLNKNYSNTVAFDIKLLITGADGTDKSKSELEIPVVITMKLPAGFTANGLELFNYHEGALLPVNFKVVGGNIRLVSDRFSTYIFAQNPSTTPSTNPSGGGGGGRSNNVNSALTTNSGSNSGEWILDATGWWIRLKDGTYPVNTWMYLDYNGVYKWYRFDAAGYMSTGWFTDADGRKYYLNPISDGTKGAMLTGWQFIDGFWYYFNPVSDGTQGALLVNTTTPDGYVVNANGQWIQ